MSDRRRLRNVVWLRLLYDAFEPSTVETHELKWRKTATLGDYLEGLPDDREWLIMVNGHEVDPVAQAGMLLEREDQIGIVLIPEGGDDGMKSVLRIVLQAAAIAAAFIPGVGWVAALAINIAVGLANAFLLTPKPPKQNAGDTSSSYGIDGAKNSATENIPYPVVYGDFRTAGNFSDCYTENVGDVQYLYIRSILNDGEIGGISSIEINEQPISSFSDVSVRVGTGRLDQDVDDWFGRFVVQSNKSQKITTDWLQHTTSSQVERLRFDLLFSSGLVNIDQKTNAYRSQNVAFSVEVQSLDPVTKQPTSEWLPCSPSSYGMIYEAVDIDGDGILSFTDAMNLQIIAQTSQAAIAATGDKPDILYRPIGSTEWISAGGFAPTGSSFIFDEAGDGSISGGTNITPKVNGVFTIDAANTAGVEVKASNGAIITASQQYASPGYTTFQVNDSRTRQIRRSFETEALPKGFYNARIRRQTATSTNQYIVDECYLSDVAEIENDKIPLSGTAYLSMRIKLSEQLNAIPNVTSVVRGSLLQEYDMFGVPTVKRWSANPAWIGLDILCGLERGVGIRSSRIDWPRWVEFAQYCDDNNVTFNGVFDTQTNVGDALQAVLRIGHAAPIPFGTKISVAIDRPRLPVASFTQANILKGSFEMTYLSMADRANQYEYTFYDRTDRNKAKVIRYVDPNAVRFNDIARTAQVQLAGVDNVDQARAELWRAIYSNRLLIRAITFDSFLDSINLALGDVALIQHDQMQWANNGLLKAGCTTTVLHLDQPVEVEAGQSYAALVHLPAVNYGTRTVQTVVGKTVMVTGAPVADLTAKRLVCGGEDYEILKMVNGSSFHTITLAAPADGISAGSTVEFWDTDVVIETPASLTGVDAAGCGIITLVTPLPVAPEALSNFVFGKVEQVRKPYALTGVSGSGIEKRKLSFCEYHDAIYAAPEIEIPIPTTQLNDRIVAQVSNLLFDYEALVESGRTIINARAHWGAGNIVNYGGADLYIRLNGSGWRTLGSAVGLTEYHFQVAPGDIVEIKAVAYNKRGDRAPMNGTPSVAGTIAVEFATLDAPTDFNAVTVAFEVDGKVQFQWSPPADATGIDAYQIQYRRTVSADWTDLGSSFKSSPAEISGVPTGNYEARIRAVSSTSISTWVSKTFTVVVAPGSLMENWTSSNDRNGSPISAPTLPATKSVEHTLNTDGSANISFEWLWAGNEADIDGFIVDVFDTV